MVAADAPATDDQCATAGFVPQPPTTRHRDDHGLQHQGRREEHGCALQEQHGADVFGPQRHHDERRQADRGHQTAQDAGDVVEHAQREPRTVLPRGGPGDECQHGEDRHRVPLAAQHRRGDDQRDEVTRQQRERQRSTEPAGPRAAGRTTGRGLDTGTGIGRRVPLRQWPPVHGRAIGRGRVVRAEGARRRVVHRSRFSRVTVQRIIGDVVQLVRGLRIVVERRREPVHAVATHLFVVPEPPAARARRPPVCHAFVPTPPVRFMPF